MLNVLVLTLGLIPLVAGADLNRIARPELGIEELFYLEALEKCEIKGTVYERSRKEVYDGIYFVLKEMPAQFCRDDRWVLTSDPALYQNVRELIQSGVSVHLLLKRNPNMLGGFEPPGTIWRRPSTIFLTPETPKKTLVHELKHHEDIPPLLNYISDKLKPALSDSYLTKIVTDFILEARAHARGQAELRNSKGPVYIRTSTQRLVQPFFSGRHRRRIIKRAAMGFDQLYGQLTNDFLGNLRSEQHESYLIVHRVIAAFVTREDLKTIGAPTYSNINYSQLGCDRYLEAP